MNVAAAQKEVTQDAALAIVEDIFKPAEATRRNTVQPTKNEVLDLLNTISSQSYIESKSAEVFTHHAYFVCLNNGLLRAGEIQWTSGSSYTKHTITPKGNKVKKALAIELAPVAPAPIQVATATDDQAARDEYNAEWLDALHALEDEAWREYWLDVQTARNAGVL